MNSMEKARCSYCQFYEPLGAEEGACHRHAPSSKLLPVLSTESDVLYSPVWPNVFHVDWCGEYVYSKHAEKRAKAFLIENQLIK